MPHRRSHSTQIQRSTARGLRAEIQAARIGVYCRTFSGVSLMTIGPSCNQQCAPKGSDATPKTHWGAAPYIAR
jgi:hypothetical protein